MESSPFQIFHKRSSKRLIVAGSGCIANAPIRLSSINRVTTEGTFVYNYDDQTITRIGCDEPLTLSSCDVDGTVKTQTKHDSNHQKWIIKTDETIVSGSCGTDQFLATMGVSDSDGTLIGVLASKFSHNAIFRLEWAAETNLI